MRTRRPTPYEVVFSGAAWDWVGRLERDEFQRLRADLARTTAQVQASPAQLELGAYRVSVSVDHDACRTTVIDIVVREV